VVSFTPRPLYPREKSPWYPLDRRLGEHQSRSGRRGEENILEPTGTRTPAPRSSSQLLVLGLEVFRKITKISVIRPSLDQERKLEHPKHEKALIFQERRSAEATIFPQTILHIIRRSSTPLQMMYSGCGGVRAVSAPPSGRPPSAAFA
jgi:hypothetical protein